MAKGTTTYQQDLIEALKDPCEAAAYLNAAIEEGDREVFLLALCNVVEANGGMGAVAAGKKGDRLLFQDVRKVLESRNWRTPCPMHWLD